MNTPVDIKKKIVRQAEANQKLEGLKVTRSSMAIASNYIVGKTSVKEAADKIRSRYGIK